MIPKKFTIVELSEFRPISFNYRLNLGFTLILESKLYTHAVLQNLI